MKILIPTIGTRGDVQPFIALAQGLWRAGHVVTLASHPIFGDLVEAHGVAFAPIGPDIDLGKEVSEIRLGSRSPLVGVMRAMRFSFEKLVQSHDDILALCRDTDLVVVPAQSAAGRNEADLLQLPHLSVTFVPWGIPYDDPGRPLIKRIAYGLMDNLVGLLTTQPLNRMRKRQGLLPVGKEGFTSLRLNLVPVSPLIYPPNPFWHPRHQVVGYWFADPPGEWQPPEDLLDFLGAGDPPLVVSLGAMSLGSLDAFESASLFVDALRQAGSRAVLQGWQEVMKEMRLPSTIYAAGSLPHSWLLPRCVGIVHHGGFGTTSASVRAGIPQLIIPHLVDQFYWGRRIHELGAGPQPVRRTGLNSSRLTAALHQLTQDGDMRAAAASLGEAIRSEQGVENSVRLIEQTFC